MALAFESSTTSASSAFSVTTTAESAGATFAISTAAKAAARTTTVSASAESTPRFPVATTESTPRAAAATAVAGLVSASFQISAAGSRVNTGLAVRFVIHGAVAAQIDALEASDSEALGERARDEGRVAHAPAVAGEVVHGGDEAALGLDPAVDAELGLVDGDLLVAGDELGRLGYLAQNGGRVGGDLGFAGHVHEGGLQGGVVGLEGQVLEAVGEFATFELGDDEPAFAFLAGTGGAADAVDVGVATGGETDLDDVGDVGEVHATGCHVGGEQDAGLAVAEAFSCAGALVLGQTGVDLEDAGGSKRVRAAAGESVGCVGGSSSSSITREVVNGAGGQSDFGCGVEVDNGLEGAGAGCLGVLDGFGAELDDGGQTVLEAGHTDDLLRDACVSGLLVVAHSLDKLEARLERRLHQLDNLARHRGAEHECLPVLFRVRGEQRHNLLDFRPETLVQQPVGLVKDQGAQVGGADSRVSVTEDVLYPARRADQDVAAVPLHLPQCRALLRSSYSRLHDDCGVLYQLPRFYRNLLGQFACGRDDDGADVVCRGARLPPSKALLGERRVGRDDVLEDGDEEAECLARSCSCLGDDVGAFEGFADGRRLHFGHRLQSHVLGE